MMIGDYKSTIPVSLQVITISLELGSYICMHFMVTITFREGLAYCCYDLSIVPLKNLLVQLYTV